MSMEKPLSSSPKLLNKHSKNRKKQQPFKVVYITNPIKFKATASEFRELVQELTGQGSVIPTEYAGLAVGEGAEGEEAIAVVAAESESTHAVVDDEATADPKLGRESGSYPVEIGSGPDGGFYSGEMVENLQGMSLIHDALKSFVGI